MFHCIRKHRLFASFASHSLQNIRTNSHTNILFDANKYMSKRIFDSERMFASHFLITGEYMLESIKLEANVDKTLSEFRIQAKIHKQIFAYQ
jgi:hypothetical protein